MWSIAKLSDRNIDLLVEIEKKKKITAQEQTIYTPFAFYLNIGFLSKYGIVASNGFSENNRKEWELTSKGKEVLKHLKKAEQIMAS
jgi:predicted transcriptional regulator